MFRLTDFDGVHLPGYNRESGLDTAPARNGFVDTVLGGFDIYGPDWAPAQTPWQLTCRAILSADSEAAQWAAINSLRAKARVRGKLTMEVDYDGQQRWAYARLDAIRHVRTYQERGYQSFEFIWNVESEWYATRAEQDFTLTGSPYTITAENAGNRPIRDAILTITAGSASITAVTIEVTGKTHLVWTGTVLPGDALVIDCGERSVLNDGANAYSGFSYGANHTIDDWLRIVGSTDIVITYTGGGTSPTGTIAYHDGWM